MKEFKNFLNQEHLNNYVKRLKDNYETTDYFLILLLRDEYKKGIRIIEFLNYDNNYNVCTIKENNEITQKLVLYDLLSFKKFKNKQKAKNSYIINTKITFCKKYNLKKFLKKYYKKVMVKKGEK